MQAALMAHIPFEHKWGRRHQIAVNQQSRPPPSSILYNRQSTQITHVCIPSSSRSMLTTRGAPDLPFPPFASSGSVHSINLTRSPRGNIKTCAPLSLKHQHTTEVLHVFEAMNTSSLRLGHTTIPCSNASSGAAADVVSFVSFPSVQRVGRIHAGEKELRWSAVKNQFLGIKVGARGAHVGRGLVASSNGSKWSAGTWLDNKASVDCEISVADAWELWNDREKIPQWMKWIDNVTVSKQKPDFSKWTLRYHAFGRDFEFSWLARNMEPVHHQKIHWRSVDGLPNRGAVQFFPQGPNACKVQLTISYELPDIMAPLGTAVGPIVESVLKNDLNRFAKLSKSKQLARV